MKKVMAIILILLSLGIIGFGSTYFMKERENKDFNIEEEKEEKEEEEEEIDTSQEELKVEEPNYDENKAKVIMYLFWGNGCPHCEDAKEWLAEIEPTYGKYFEVEEYEVWYNEGNAALMEKVGEYLNEDASGVPFIVIGDTVFKGFAEPYKVKILETIFSEYEKNERIDVLKNIG